MSSDVLNDFMVIERSQRFFYNTKGTEKISSTFQTFDTFLWWTNRAEIRTAD